MRTWIQLGVVLGLVVVGCPTGFGEEDESDGALADRYFRALFAADTNEMRVLQHEEWAYGEVVHSLLGVATRDVRNCLGAFTGVARCTSTKPSAAVTTFKCLLEFEQGTADGTLLTRDGRVVGYAVRSAYLPAFWVPVPDDLSYWIEKGKEVAFAYATGDGSRAYDLMSPDFRAAHPRSQVVRDSAAAHASLGSVTSVEFVSRPSPEIPMVLELVFRIVGANHDTHVRFRFQLGLAHTALVGMWPVPREQVAGRVGLGDKAPGETGGAPRVVPPVVDLAPEQTAEAEKQGVPATFANEIGMRFVLIPAGTFPMGSPETEEGRNDDETYHEASIDKPFYMAVTEVTNRQYRCFLAGHRSPKGSDGDDRPVVFVNFHQAQRFATWLTKFDGEWHYRLPTEPEWERACRAGTTTRFWTGDDEETLAPAAWYFRNSGTKRLPRSTKWNAVGAMTSWGCRSHRVARKVASPWGLYDMHGNVFEWCDGPLQDAFGGAPADADSWHEGGRGSRIYRGGSWLQPVSSLRSAARHGNKPGVGRFSLGFRLVADLPEPGERRR